MKIYITQKHFHLKPQCEPNIIFRQFLSKHKMFTHFLFLMKNESKIEKSQQRPEIVGI